jgi:hypothetical protein
MGRDMFRLLFGAAIIAFAVLYGMELARSGIAGVYGPMAVSDRELFRQTESVLRPGGGASSPDGQASRWGTGGWTGGPESAGVPDEKWDVPPWDGRRPIVDRLAGEAARALNRLSQGGIRLIVTAFSRTTELPAPAEAEPAGTGPANRAYGE